MTQHSALYHGTVVHHRLRPVRHRLDYRVFSLLLDLDELPDLARRLRLFRHNRPGLISFYDRDHGPGDGRPLKPWVEAHLQAAGIAAGGAIRVLSFPRVLGFVFNPLSVFFCYRPDGSLAAILHEVNNTFGERHCYLIPAQTGADGLVRQTCDKVFYVSPFMTMASTYHFRIRPPADGLTLAIRQTGAEGPLLQASLVGQRQDLTDGSLLRAWARHPLMTAKVIAGIHWEALHLWRKGMRLQPRPPAPAQPVSVIPSPRTEDVLP